MSSWDLRFIQTNVQKAFKVKVGVNGEWSAPANDYALLLLTQAKKKRKHTTQEPLAIEDEPAFRTIEDWKCPNDPRDDHEKAVPNQRCLGAPRDVPEKAAPDQTCSDDPRVDHEKAVANHADDKNVPKDNKKDDALSSASSPYHLLLRPVLCP